MDFHWRFCQTVTWRVSPTSSAKMGLLTVRSRPNLYASIWLSRFQPKIVEQHFADKKIFPETDIENQVHAFIYIKAETVDLGVNATSTFNAYLTVSKRQIVSCVSRSRMVVVSKP